MDGFPGGRFVDMVFNNRQWSSDEGLRTRAECVFKLTTDIVRLDSEIVASEATVAHANAQIKSGITSIAMKYGKSMGVKTREGLRAELASGRSPFSPAERRVVAVAIERRTKARRALGEAAGMRSMAATMRETHEAAIREMTVNKTFYDNALLSAVNLQSSKNMNENLAAMERIHAYMAVENQDSFVDTQKHYMTLANDNDQGNTNTTDEFARLLCDALYPSTNANALSHLSILASASPSPALPRGAQQHLAAAAAQPPPYTPRAAPVAHAEINLN